MEENHQRGSVQEVPNQAPNQHHRQVPPAPQLLVFDLDGTLIDSKDDLIASVNAVRAHLDLPPLPGPTIASYVGNGAPVLIRKALGPTASDETIAAALDYFIRYYHDHSLDQTRLYPGCQEVLAAARARQIPCAILTNKPVKISHHILAGLKVAPYFFQVYGGNSFATKKPDPEGLLSLIREANVSPAHTYMIGDSSVDIQTARNAQTFAVGLTYGLQPESLITVPPDLLLDRMEDLLPYL
ncbi:MAG: HAD-IA family hydrolase [Bryobacter sp.]|nr:HAD-IA family hydrolase [Bryobacter sp.]